LRNSLKKKGICGGHRFAADRLEGSEEQMKSKGRGPKRRALRCGMSGNGEQSAFQCVIPGVWLREGGGNRPAKKNPHRETNRNRHTRRLSKREPRQTGLRLSREIKEEGRASSRWWRRSARWTTEGKKLASSNKARKVQEKLHVLIRTQQDGIRFPEAPSAHGQLAA